MQLVTEAMERVRYGDTDRQGHVNNAAYATYFESGRMELLTSKALRDVLPSATYVLARIAINYHREVLWPDTLEIKTAIKHLGRSSITLEQTIISSAGLVVAAADSVVVHVNTATRRSEPLPKSIRDLLGRHTALKSAAP